MVDKKEVRKKCKKTLRELDEKIKDMAEELWELRLFRAELRKVIDGAKEKTVRVERKTDKGEGGNIPIKKRKGNWATW
jgi:regulator of replication initiation timing